MDEDQSMQMERYERPIDGLMDGLKVEDQKIYIYLFPFSATKSKKRTNRLRLFHLCWAKFR